MQKDDGIREENLKVSIITESTNLKKNINSMKKVISYINWSSKTCRAEKHSIWTKKFTGRAQDKLEQTNLAKLKIQNHK